MALSGAFSFIGVKRKNARKVLIIHRICNFIETFGAENDRKVVRHLM